MKYKTVFTIANKINAIFKTIAIGVAENSSSIPINKPIEIKIHKSIEIAKSIFFIHTQIKYKISLNVIFSPPHSYFLPTTVF